MEERLLYTLAPAITILFQGIILEPRAGTAMAALRPQNGIHVNNADNIIIGGTVGEIDRNILSGNTQVGIRLQESLNLIINYYIGTDKNGTADLGNKQPNYL